MIPVSAVLADKDVMLCIQPGENGRFAFISTLYFINDLFLNLLTTLFNQPLISNSCPS